MIAVFGLGFSAHARNLGFLHAETPGLCLVDGCARKKIDISDSITPKEGALASHYCSVDTEIFQGVAVLSSRATRLPRSSIPLALLRPP